MPAYDFLPRLQKLCLSLGFNNPVIEKSGKLALPAAGSPGDIAQGARAESSEQVDGLDHIIILSTTVPYEQNWGGYSGLPGQHRRETTGAGPEETPADFILPYLRQYQFAQTHIYLGYDSTGRFVITLPDFLAWGKEGIDCNHLNLSLEKIAEPNAKGQFEPLVVAGSLVTFAGAAHFRQAMDKEMYSGKPGVFSPIGEHLGPEMFRFVPPALPTDSPSPFSAMLLPMMPWIVAHRTPHLAATLVHLQANFSRQCEAFAATGPNDLRNLLCVAGLDIDMKGFRGRTDRYFVPWHACWKRHGYCYNNIYPLLQDDLFVALMNFSKAEGR